MRINWVEHLEKQGQISSSAKEEIYNDCMNIIKNSDEIIKIASGNAAAGAQPPNLLAGMIGAGFLAMKAKDAYHNFRIPAVTYKDIQKNRANLSNESFIKAPGDVEKAEARFNEIVEVAPSVAQDYSVAKKLVERRLHSGLSEGDVMTLATMQRQFHNVGNRGQFALRDKIRQYDTADRMKMLKKQAEAVGETYATIYSIVKEAAGDNWLNELVGKITVNNLEKQAAFNFSDKVKNDIYRLVTRGVPNTIGQSGKALTKAYETFVNKRNIAGARKGIEASQKAMGEITEKLESLLERAKPQPYSTGKLLHSVGLLTGIPLAAGIGLGGFKHMENKLEQKKLQKKLEASFDAAMKSKDTAGETLRSNRADAREAFNTLAHFAPHVAAQPTAARSFMSKMVDIGGAGAHLTTDEIKTLAQTQELIRKGKVQPFAEGFGAGVSSMGLGGAMVRGLSGAGDVMSEQLGSALNPPV